MNFKKNESATKLRGGYYTPAPIAKFLAKWVMGARPDRILEPSCGDGAFIRALSGLHRRKLAFTGVELLAEEANKAKLFANENKSLQAEIFNADFLSWSLSAIDSGDSYDAILGNPPYIRYQYLDASDQKLSERIFLRNQLSFTKHTNAWVPFVIASINLLNANGRLAMVIPSEILHVLHAQSLRKFLLDTCEKILLIDPNELLFSEALQGTVLLLAQKKSRAEAVSEGVSIVSVPDNSFLHTDPDQIFHGAEYISGDVLSGKWMKVLLQKDELDALEKARSLGGIKSFIDVATVDVGIVTGANKFFLVSKAIVDEYDLHSYAKPMFGRSEHCPGLIYSQGLHDRNLANGLPGYFLDFGKAPISKLSAGARRYIKEGEAQGLNSRYKCRIRSPWYSVPSLYATEIGMLKRSHNYPRLILNKAGAYTTDTAYRITTSLKAEDFVFGFINSLTALTAELEGRHYGGGVLELVPSEIERLLVPVVSLDKGALAKLDKLVVSGADASLVLEEQDSIVLAATGMKKKHYEIIHGAWQRIRARRHRMLGVDKDDEQS